MAPTRDYYADLELPPLADIPEIKKQFRRLALKYHPDRNPGREVEVNSQFQIIQSAHEILSDPQKKAKYDVTYSRSSRFPSVSGVKGNPWQKVSQQFPPPPRRSTNARAATSGAQRWSSRFAKGVPPTAKQQTASDSEAKKNAARAFENMRSRTAQQDPRPPPPPPPPRTESAKQRAQAAFGTRKAGFQPRSSATGDEPPVSSRNYFSRSTAAQAPPPNPPPRSSRLTTIPDPLEQFRNQESFTDTHNRQSSPYSWYGSEKTDPFDGIPQGRDKFTTEPTRRRSPPTAGQGLTEEQRHRSASVPKFPLYQADEARSRHKVRPDDGSKQGVTAGTATNSSSQAHLDPSGHSTAAADQASIVTNRPRSARRSGSAPSIFNIAMGDDTLEQTPAVQGANDFSKTGVDDINTRFVHDDIANPWSFKAGNRHADGPTNKTYQPASGRPTNRHPPPMQPDLRKADYTRRQPQAEASPKGFNAESWKFSPHNFAPQPVPGLSVSPTRSHRANSKRIRLKPTAGTASVVESSSDGETYEWRGRNASRTKNAAADSPLAMDIDTPPSGLDAAIPEISSARNIPVEPSRPEWRPGNVDFVRGEGKPPRPDKIPAHTNAAVGSEDSEDFIASFADLESVPPIARSNMGLGSLADLKANLPFESKASEDSPIDQPPKFHRLTLPPFPEAPRLPPTMAIEGIKPNAASWVKYLAEFENYLRQWDKVNDQVVDHFETRKTHIAGIRQSKGYASPRTNGDGDICEYFSWVQQDNDVRQRWNAACEKHELRLREFMAFRKKMK